MVQLKPRIILAALFFCFWWHEPSSLGTLPSHRNVHFDTCSVELVPELFLRICGCFPLNFLHPQHSMRAQSLIYDLSGHLWLTIRSQWCAHYTSFLPTWTSKFNLTVIWISLLTGHGTLRTFFSPEKANLMQSWVPAISWGRISFRRCVIIDHNCQ